MDIKLFRKEVMEHRAERLHGEVNLAIPVQWQAIGYLLLTMLMVALIFMFSSSYARVETVSGVIVPDKGIVIALPTRPGLVTQLLVEEGQAVEQGAGFFHRNRCAAKFAAVACAHMSAQLHHHRLLAITNAKNGQAAVEYALRCTRGIGVRGGGWAT